MKPIELTQLPQQVSIEPWLKTRNKHSTGTLRGLKSSPRRITRISGMSSLLGPLPQLAAEGFDLSVAGQHLLFKLEKKQQCKLP